MVAGWTDIAFLRAPPDVSGIDFKPRRTAQPWSIHRTNFVEHPKLVAQRIENYARLVGRERVVAGTDCGFATFAAQQNMVVPSIAWAKLAALAEGAKIASGRLWNSVSSSAFLTWRQIASRHPPFRLAHRDVVDEPRAAELSCYEQPCRLARRVPSGASVSASRNSRYSALKPASFSAAIACCRTGRRRSPGDRRCRLAHHAVKGWRDASFLGRQVDVARRQR